MKFAIVPVHPEEEELLMQLLQRHGIEFHTRASGAPGEVLTVFLKEGNSFFRVEARDIIYMNSDHVYVSVHTAQRRYLVRSSLSAFLERIGDSSFCRIHRSHAVNLSYVERVESDSVVAAGHTLPVSRSYRDALFKALKIK